MDNDPGTLCGRAADFTPTPSRSDQHQVMDGWPGEGRAGSTVARWLGVAGVLLPLLAVSLAGPASAAPAAPAEEVGPVVLVGVPGLTWSDVSQDSTPALWSLLEDGAVGTLAARSVRASACPADGWLAVSAGRRAADASAGGATACRAPGEPVEGRLLRWPVYLEQADASSYDAHPGVFGNLLSDHGVRAQAIGPGAAIALADSNGRVVGDYQPRPALGPDLVALVRDSVASNDLVVVDAGALVDPSGADPTRYEQADALDDRVGAVLDAAGPGATVVVAALADSGPTPRLDLLAVRGVLDGQPASGLLTSSSTRQPGIAQTLDLTPTVVDLLDLPTPADLVGAPLRAGSGDEVAAALLARVRDLDAASAAARPIVGWIFLGLVVFHLGYLALVAFLALRARQPNDHDKRRPWPAWLAIVSVGLAAVPVSTFLAHLLPWWRWGGAPVFLGAMLLVAAVLTTLVLAAARRADPLLPMAVVGGLTAVVLGGDVLTGSRLTIAAPMGLQPLVAGRFFGLGNVQFALFATGCMLLAIVVADRAVRAGKRRLGAAAVAALGLSAVVVVGTPGLGSDLGGPPSIVPMFTFFGLIVAGVRLRPARVAAVLGGAAAVVAAFAVGDWLRPAADRTHLGRFVASTLDGDIGPILARKMSQNLDILLGSPQTLLALGAVALLVFVLFRPRRWGGPALEPVLDRYPLLAPGVGCLFVGLGIGTAVNDSGIVVLAMGASLAVPLLVAARCAGGPRTAGSSLGSAAAGDGPQEAAEPQIEQATRGQRPGDVAVLRGTVQGSGEVGAANPVEQLAGHLADPHAGPEQVDGHRGLDPPAGRQR